MSMLATTAGFFLLTALFIWRHMQTRDVGAGLPVAAAVRTRPCPRCNAAVPVGSTFCPGCGVPQQLFELVVAPTSAPSTAAAAGKLRALVRADMCVGCGTCVASCPEPGALTMRGHVAVVDDDKCQGHGECVRGCPVGAISVTTGGAVNRVSVPLIDANFETNVPGLYIVGELGGRGLIKNAINEGKLAIEHVARANAVRAVADISRDDAPLDVVIVGSGPAGLSAGLEAHRRGLRYVVLEQGSLSDTVRKYPRHKLLLAEPLQIPLYGDLWIADASKEALLQVWETIVANTGLLVRTGEKVDHIVRDGASFRVQTPKAEHRAHRVVLATGRRGTPRRLGVPGEELGHVLYDIVDMDEFAQQHVLVVGGGDSAIESVIGLARQDRTHVTLSYRGAELTRVKERNRDKLERAVARGNVRMALNTLVREIRANEVVLHGAGQVTTVRADTVVIRAGGEAPYAFLEKLGVRIVSKDLAAPAREREPARAMAG